MRKIIHNIGQVLNYMVSITIWMLERQISRLPFFITALILWYTAHELQRSILGEKLLGAACYLPEEQRIGFFAVVGMLLLIPLVLLFCAPIAHGISCLLNYILEELLQRNQDKKLTFNNEKVGKVLFAIWSVVAAIVCFMAVVGYCEYSILCGIIAFVIDELLLYYFFIWSYEHEPIETLSFLGAFCSGAGGTGSGGTYVIFKL